MNNQRSRKPLRGKKQFLEELSKNLRGLSKEDKREILEDYEAHFIIGKKKKRKESEIAKALGNPKQIAKHAKLELAIEKAEKKKSIGNISRVIFASLGLGFFNLIFMIGPFFGLLGILIGLLATGFSLTISGIAIIVAGFLAPLMVEFIALGGISLPLIFLVGIGLASFGLLFLIGTFYVSKGFYKITLKYVKFNMKIIRSEEE